MLICKEIIVLFLIYDCCFKLFKPFSSTISVFWLSLSTLGTVLGYPIINVSVSLRDFKCSSGASPAMLTACAAQCTTGLVKMAEPQLLEPIMKLEVVFVFGHFFSGSVSIICLHR